MSDMSMRLSLQDDVSSKLSQVSSSVKSTSSELKSLGQQLDNAFKSTAPSQFASSLSNSMSSAEKDVDALGNALDSAFDALDSTNVDIDLGLDDAAKEADDFANSAQDAGDSINDFAETADDAGESVDDLASSAEDLGENINGIDGSGSNLDDLANEADQAGSSMENAEGKATSLTGTLEALFAAVSAAAVLDTISDFTNASIELGENYTQTISQVAAISGADAEGMEQLESAAREYGSTTIYSASEAAEALKYMSLAGWDATQSTEALGGVLNLAASAGMDLGEASDIVTDYLTAFGMEASQATELADAMSYAQANSNTSVSQLSEAYRNSAATMNASGQSVYTTTALLEAMANQGYKGSTAGTALAAVMRDITNSMEDGAIQIGDATVAVSDQEGNFRDLTDILYDVQGAVDGLGSAERSTALSDTFTSRSLRAVNMVLEEGVENIYDYEDALMNAGGTAAEMADIMTDNLTGDKEMLSSAWQELQLEAFESIEDPLREATQWITAEVIPALTEWVPDAFQSIANGVSTIGDAIGPMLTSILRDPSGITNVLKTLGTAFVAFKGVDFASSIGTNLSNWASNLTIGNEFALAAAAVAAAVVAIKAAVDEYNAIQIENSLSERFGSLDLDSTELSNMASRVLDMKWTVNIDAALGYFTNAKELADQAEEALKANRVLEWKAQVGITLTEDEQNTYASNVQTFINSRTGELEQLVTAAEVAVQGVFGDSANTLVQKMETWSEEDFTELNGLSESLTTLIQNALEDGVISVEEQAAIDILQQKINNVLAGWQQAESEAEWQLLENKYGRMSASELTAGGFEELVGDMQSQMEDAYSSLEEATLDMYQVFNGWENSGKITAEGNEALRSLWDYQNLNDAGDAMIRALSLESNTLTDTYGDVLEAEYEQIERSTAGITYDLEDVENRVKAYQGNSDVVSSGDFGALNELYETMAPSVDSMGKLIDAYRQEGRAVPQAIMDSYNEAIAIGAASGDESAAWQMYANDLLENGSEELKENLTNPDNPLYDTVRDYLPEEMVQAIDRASVETTEDADLTDLFNELLGEAEVGELDMGVLSDLLEAVGVDMSEYLEENGIDVEGNPKMNLNDFDIEEAAELSGLTATGNAMELDGGEIALEYEVNTGDTMSHIAEQAGVTLEELKAANPDMENYDLIYEGDLIWIPQVDTSEAGEAVDQLQDEVQEMADEATAEPIEAEQDVEETFTVSGEAGEAVDELRENAQEAADAATAEPIEAEQQVNETFTAGETDTSALDGSYEGSSTITLTQSNNADAVYTEVGDALVTAFGAPIPVDGDAEVEIAETNNAAAVYSEVVSALQSAFAVSIPVSANASVTINYSLANPSATVDFGGAGSGSATVTATMHAEGGIFDTPHLGMIAEAGPEAIIPLNGSDDSVSLWEEAGKQLGFEYIEGSGSGSSGSEEKASGGGSSERTINIEINGNGAIQVQGGSGASKDEIVDVMMENLRDVFEQIVEEEILEEGDGTYEW